MLHIFSAKSGNPWSHCLLRVLVLLWGGVCASGNVLGQHLEGAGVGALLVIS